MQETQSERIRYFLTKKKKNEGEEKNNTVIKCNRKICDRKIIKN